MDIKIEIEDLTIDGELFDTATGKAVFDSLPIRTRFDTWGDEIYFSTSVSQELDDTAKELVEIGDLGYWPTGKAVCIFFGPTPMSAPGEIRPASAVNIIGRIRGDAGRFKTVMSADSITISRA